MPADFHYATPRHVERLEDCKFYHSMDLPGVGEVLGDWDLRETVDAYLGGFEFSGKRVLDVGTASGFLTFEMEKRGAEVVSFDMERATQWDMVPYWDLRHERAETFEQREGGVQRIRNAYWFAHEKLQSRAQAYYGDNIYALPDALGTFDVVFFGMILSHLRDPFQALYSASRLSRDTVIVTNQAMEARDPIVKFLPDPATSSPLYAWWSFSERSLARMLGVLGFEVQYTVRHGHRCLVPGERAYPECVAFVAKRRAT